ncbi:MAG: hypothetical protein DMG28_09680 [Acidobacteria bacterium]|nr:MAG: hypothetical protein DMG28_09680 [Acidobacteriota bacterium]
MDVGAEETRLAPECDALAFVIAAEEGATANLNTVEGRSCLELRATEVSIAVDVGAEETRLAPECDALALVITTEEGALIDLDAFEIHCSKFGTTSIKHLFHMKILEAAPIRKGSARNCKVRFGVGRSEIRTPGEPRPLERGGALEGRKGEVGLIQEVGACDGQFVFKPGVLEIKGTCNDRVGDQDGFADGACGPRSQVFQPLRRNGPSGYFFGRFFPIGRPGRELQRFTRQ